MDLKLHTCCFFGHRKIAETDDLEKTLYNEIEKLIINKNVNTFLFGSNSQFNDLCHATVSKLKAKYPHLKRIYVRAEFPYIDENYRKHLLKSYEDTYFPEKIMNAGKASYIERNFEMIDNSTYCICYYDKNYLPPKKRSNKRDVTMYQPQSGTKAAFDYAVKKKLAINNIFMKYGKNRTDDVTISDRKMKGKKMS